MDKKLNIDSRVKKLVNKLEEAIINESSICVHIEHERIKTRHSMIPELIEAEDNEIRICCDNGEISIDGIKSIYISNGCDESHIKTEQGNMFIDFL